DIRTLIKGPIEEDRAHAAHKICRCIEEAELSLEERKYAEEIIAVMAQDAAVLVRRALAVALKNSPKLPHEVANKLARDVDSIALPVILNSPMLTDADLVEIVRASPPIKQVAVASRETLSPVVTGAIAKFRSEEHTSELQSRENLVCRLLLE